VSAETTTSRRWLRVLAVTVETVVLVPAAILLFMVVLFVGEPSLGGYPACDPFVQHWCKFDAGVQLRAATGLGVAAVASVCLVVAWVQALRQRLIWPWLVATPVLLTISLTVLAIR
jgi:hypothetical protein